MADLPLVTNPVSTGDRPQPRAIARRGLLRGGAIVAGAAAGAAAVALSGQTAQADDGDPLTLGTENAASAQTTLSIGAEDGTASPALILQNANGPALKLQPLPVGWAGELQVGEMVGTDLGPEVGVEGPQGIVKTPIATWLDLSELSTPFPTTPSRVLDTRTAAGRNSIVRRSSADAVAANGLLRAGSWIDVSVVETGDDYELEAVFANLTVTNALTGGHATLYAPGLRPPTSNLNYVAKQTVANAAFVRTGGVQGHHVVRLYTTADAYYVIDISGGVASGPNLVPLQASARAKGGRRAMVSRMRKAIERTGR